MLYWLFALVLAVGKLVFRRNLLAALLKDMTLPDAVWTRLTWALGRVLRRHGHRQLVRRVPLSDRHLGQLQGLGRHRPVPAVRASAQGIWLARYLPELKSMTDIAATLRARLAALAPSALEIHDDSADHAGHAGAAGGGGHFSLVIVSKAFSGLPRLARHQQVLDRVGDLLPHPIHALSIKALAPEEFS